jgi:hypothetical protein
MELYEASNQWAQRPDDERLATLKELYMTCLDYFKRSEEQEDIRLTDLKVLPTEQGDLLLNSGTALTGFTNWAFRQCCQRVGAPAAYLQGLPAGIAATCLNHGLGKLDKEGSKTNLLVQNLAENRRVVMAATSDKYSRIWNWEVADRLLRLELKGEGWRVPPARPARDGQAGARRATEQDVLDDGGFGLSVKIGDLIAPAGIYASDHDCFVFMVNTQRSIGDGLARGFFVSNSEVGAASFKLTRFLYRHVCGNHIVWGAEGTSELKLRHVGRAPERAWQEFEGEVQKYANSSVGEDEAKLEAAMHLRLGGTKDEVLDKLFGLGTGASRRVLAQAYESTEQLYPTDGDPYTAWGMVNGMTRISQLLPYGEERVAVDLAAGKVLHLVG